MYKLLQEIKACTLCAENLPLGPNPVIKASKQAKIASIGQAPGTRVHKTGIPWNDPSGNTLRKWLNTDRDTFYSSEKIAIVPMGFCYPGKGKSGDLPPRKECAPIWHQQLWNAMPNIELFLLIGQYAQKYYLENPQKNLTETVKNYRDYLPKYFPLPHPSPRNRIWLKRNTWFESEVIPELQEIVKVLI